MRKELNLQAGCTEAHNFLTTVGLHGRDSSGSGTRPAPRSGAQTTQPPRRRASPDLFSPRHAQPAVGGTPALLRGEDAAGRASTRRLSRLVMYSPERRTSAGLDRKSTRLNSSHEWISR